MNNCVFNYEHKCTALKKMKCKGCSFCKTKEELAEGRQKATNRIRTLSPKQQVHIFSKYYSRTTKTE